MKFSLHFCDHGILPLLGPGSIAFDVGAKFEKRELYFDHHHGSVAACCSFDVLRPRIDELEKLRGVESIKLYCHKNPDLDCAASAFYSLDFLTHSELSKNFLNALSSATGDIDQGRVTPLDLYNPVNDFNFYMYFLVLPDLLKDDKYSDGQSLAVIKMYFKKRDLEYLGAGKYRDEWSMLYFLCFLNAYHEWDPEGKHLKSAEFHGKKLFSRLDDFVGWLNKDRTENRLLTDILYDIRGKMEGYRYEFNSILKEKRYRLFECPMPTAEISKRRLVTALYVQAPFGILPFFKSLRGTLYPGLTDKKISVLIFHPSESERRFIISIDPTAPDRLTLKGLGLALNQENERLRRERGMAFPMIKTSIQSRYWHLVDGKPTPDPLYIGSPDPWYDGRGHSFSIVDAPSSMPNRFLNDENVTRILERGEWIELVREYETHSYRKWLKGEPLADRQGNE